MSELVDRRDRTTPARREDGAGRRAARGEFASVRTGRPPRRWSRSCPSTTTARTVPLQQLAGFSVPEARLLVVTPVSTKATMGAIEKAIRNSDLGLNPSNDGIVIRLVFPPLTEERRKELVKLVRHMAEEGKVALRNLRRAARTTSSPRRTAKRLATSSRGPRRSSTGSRTRRRPRSTRRSSTRSKSCSRSKEDRPWARSCSKRQAAGRDQGRGEHHRRRRGREGNRTRRRRPPAPGRRARYGDRRKAPRTTARVPRSLPAHRLVRSHRHRAPPVVPPDPVAPPANTTSRIGPSRPPARCPRSWPTRATTTSTHGRRSRPRSHGGGVKAPSPTRRVQRLLAPGGRRDPGRCA